MSAPAQGLRTADANRDQHSEVASSNQHNEVANREHPTVGASAEWLDVGATTELPVGSRKLVFLPTPPGAPPRTALLLHTERGLFALRNSCPHAGASLANGRLVGQQLQCPAHGLRFDVGTGECVGAPALKVSCWPLHAQGDRLQLQLPAEP